MVSNNKLLAEIIAPTQSEIKISELQQSVEQIKVSEAYFSDIIQVQTGIFSLMITILLAISYFFNWRMSKSFIKDEMESHMSKLNTKNDEEFENKVENLQNMFRSGMEQQEISIKRLTGNNYRTLGQFWDSEKKFETAFIWWFRAAHQFASISNESLARICLSAAKDSIERIASGLKFKVDSIGEYQKLMSEVSDIYKIEKDMLDKALKAALDRKPQTEKNI